jgi:ketosteroid isomerase-like protein
MLTTSVIADVDALFALYSPDFEYVHEKYGGSYSRDLLYRNMLKAIEAKRFKDQLSRYQIEAVLPGLNAAAVRRYQQTGTPAYHLAMFEFADGKVRRIVEYW